ncbi:inner membrane protein YejM [Gluconacetobacter sp. SXCC-1]|nr:hypothetical protein CT154_05145 [Komagataeibacter xylinus]EGG75032.1 inner membrane protein YejM [Gluconacetobacter sp. SXCC-1]
MLDHSKMIFSDFFYNKKIRFTVLMLLIIFSICIENKKYIELFLYSFEFIVILSICALFGSSYRMIEIFMRLFYGFILAVQLSSISISGNVLSPLALENLGHPAVIGSLNMLWASIIEIGSVLIVFLSGINFSFYSALISIPILLGIKHSSSYEFFKPIVSVTEERLFVWNMLKNQKMEVKKLQHDFIYYPEKNSNPIERKHYNVIVIFTEGTSLAVISPELTPNIWGLMHNSLHYTGYFNHTAATFRGLRGQNASFYQMTGGYTESSMGLGQISHKEILDKMKSGKSITTLPEIFQENGYNTFFQLPCSINDNLSQMMSTMDFNHLFTMEDINATARTKWPVPPGMAVKWLTNNDLTDGDSYRLLWKNIQILHEQARPFYYGIYTVGTHVGLDSPEFRYKDGM